MIFSPDGDFWRFFTVQLLSRIDQTDWKPFFISVLNSFLKNLRKYYNFTVPNLRKKKRTFWFGFARFWFGLIFLSGDDVLWFVLEKRGKKCYVHFDEIWKNKTYIQNLRLKCKTTPVNVIQHTESYRDTYTWMRSNRTLFMSFVVFTTALIPFKRHRCLNAFSHPPGWSKFFQYLVFNVIVTEHLTITCDLYPQSFRP